VINFGLGRDDWRKTTEDGAPVVYYNDKGEKDKNRNLERFELVKILYDDESEQVVWWTGGDWDGLKPLRKKKVIAWKPKGNMGI